MNNRASLRLRAFAKLNLSLAILGRRPDGYHEIDSLMHRIAWWDEVELIPLPGDELRLVLETDGAGTSAVPGGPDNLALKAARWLREAFDIRAGVEIRLRKRVAAGAGLGGGSADAAVVLLGLRRLWRIPVPAAELRPLSAGVGADVPFLLGGRAARVRGIGERVEPLPAWPGLYLVLLPLPRPVSTAWAYAAWDAWEAGAGKRPERGRISPAAGGSSVLDGFVRSFLARDLAGLARYSCNDFEPVVAAHYPEVSRALSDLRATGAVTARMTGSGPTVWGLYASRREAEQAWQRLRQAYPQARLTRTL
ncbi:MAG TPA: 4-(cytidine 5'-diphospho)-2-C-methyl-D-erythritol kinase [Thermaerobacter sp.]